MNIEPIVDFASLAIAFHNKPVFKELVDKSNQQICFKLHPYSSVFNAMFQNCGKKC
ncbi:hypothetical protein [Desulfobacula phenolica]|uniref:hypothetical protein n=1 Tax=Desulfobacula phenolica TaxID=90732 RepID=UPI001587CDE7|nr:hypothetical protein [Desulfobacula phenolica]